MTVTPGGGAHNCCGDGGGNCGERSHDHNDCTAGASDTLARHHQGDSEGPPACGDACACVRSRAEGQGEQQQRSGTEADSDAGVDWVAVLLSHARLDARALLTAVSRPLCASDHERGDGSAGAVVISGHSDSSPPPDDDDADAAVASRGDGLSSALLAAESAPPHSSTAPLRPLRTHLEDDFM